MNQSPARRATDGQGSVLPQAKQVFQNAYFTVLVEERLRIAVTVRTDKPFGSVAALQGGIGELGDALDRMGRSRYALLVDVRAGPGRNDPDFEAALQRLLPRWLGGFRRVGVLVRSVAGLMQIQRHAKQDGIERWPSTDEAALVKYLTQP